jgi:transcriptional regulator with XRE-family HTH domain
LDKDIKRIIAQNIRFYRKKSGLTQQGLGECLGISEGQVNYIENMKRPIDVIKLKKLSNLFNVPMDVFLNKEVSKHDANVFAFRSDNIDSKTLDAIAFLNEFASDLIRLKGLE